MDTLTTISLTARPSPAPISTPKNQISKFTDSSLTWTTRTSSVQLSGTASPQALSRSSMIRIAKFRASAHLLVSTHAQTLLRNLIKTIHIAWLMTLAWSTASGSTPRSFTSTLTPMSSSKMAVMKWSMTRRLLMCQASALMRRNLFNSCSNESMWAYGTTSILKYRPSLI